MCTCYSNSSIWSCSNWKWWRIFEKVKVWLTKLTHERTAPNICTDKVHMLYPRNLDIFNSCCHKRCIPLWFVADNMEVKVSTLIHIYIKLIRFWPLYPFSLESQLIYCTVFQCFWLRQEPKESQSLFVCSVQVCLELSVFISRQSAVSQLVIIPSEPKILRLVNFYPSCIFFRKVLFSLFESEFCGDQKFNNRRSSVDLCTLEQHVSDIQLRW